jgi:hypothetical protein
MGGSMKVPRFSSNKDNPAIKGMMSAEDITRADWERNYKQKGISFPQAKMSIKAHVDSGQPIFRVRNTLILLTLEDGFEEVKFHTVTADPFEVYSSMMLMFLVSLSRNKGTQIAYTYIDDKKIFRAIKRLVGEYGELDSNDQDPEKGKYILTLEIGPFTAAMQQKADRRVQ